MALKPLGPFSWMLNGVWIGSSVILLTAALLVPEWRGWIGVIARVILGLGALGNGARYLAAQKRLPGFLLVFTGAGLLVTAGMGYGFNP